MGATFIEYPEPQQNNPQKDFNATLPTNLQQADLVRMGMSQTQADKVIADVGYGGTGGTQPSTRDNINSGTKAQWIPNLADKREVLRSVIPPSDNSSEEGSGMGGGQRGASGYLGMNFTYFERFYPAIQQEKPDLVISDASILRRAQGDPRRTNRVEFVEKIRQTIFNRELKSIEAMTWKLREAIATTLAEELKAKEKRGTLLGNIRGAQLELECAFFFGTSMHSLDKAYPSPDLRSDFENAEFMVEVTVQKSAKTKQMKKYVVINDMERHIILYAPNYRNTKEIKEMRSNGVEVETGGWDQLFKRINRLRLG